MCSIKYFNLILKSNRKFKMLLQRISSLSSRSIIPKRMTPLMKTMSTAAKEEVPNAYAVPVQAMHWLMGGSVLG